MTRAARQADPQAARRRRLGAVERLPVGRRRHRVADRVEQVAAQRQRRRPVRPGGVRADRVDERQRVAVGADRRLGLGGAQQVRHGVGGRARPAAGGGRSGPARRPARSAGWRRRGGCGGGGGAARRRGARRARGRGGSGSRRSPARRSAPRGRRRGGRTPRPPAGRTGRRTRRCRTTSRRRRRAAAPRGSPARCRRSCWRRAPAPTAGSLAARRASSLTANGMPPAERGDLARRARASARRRGGARARRRRRRPSGPSSSSVGAVAVEQALAGLGQRRRSSGPAGG